MRQDKRWDCGTALFGAFSSGVGANLGLESEESTPRLSGLQRPTPVQLRGRKQAVEDACLRERAPDDLWFLASLSDRLIYAEPRLARVCLSWNLTANLARPLQTDQRLWR